MKAKVERRDPAEVVGHRVGRDEERLVGRAEMVGEPSPVGLSRHLALLLDCPGRSPTHAANQVDGEDPGILGGPPREVCRHVPECRADLQHAPRIGMRQQREHHPRVMLARVRAQCPANVRGAEMLSVTNRHWPPSREREQVAPAFASGAGLSGKLNSLELVSLASDNLSLEHSFPRALVRGRRGRSVQRRQNHEVRSAQALTCRAREIGLNSGKMLARPLAIYRIYVYYTWPNSI